MFQPYKRSNRGQSIVVKLSVAESKPGEFRQGLKARDLITRHIATVHKQVSEVRLVRQVHKTSVGHISPLDAQRTQIQPTIYVREPIVANLRVAEVKMNHALTVL